MKLKLFSFFCSSHEDPCGGKADFHKDFSF